MKTFFLLFNFAFVILNCLAADRINITGTALYPDFTAVIRQSVQLTPLAPLPRLYYTNGFSRQPVSRLTDTNGFFSFSNAVGAVAWGYYRLDIPGNPGSSYLLTVGTNLSGTVNFATLVTNTSSVLPPNPSSNYLTEAQSDARYATLGSGGGTNSGTTYTNNTGLPGVVSGSAIGTNLSTLATAAGLQAATNSATITTQLGLGTISTRGSNDFVASLAGLSTNQTLTTWTNRYNTTNGMPGGWTQNYMWGRNMMNEWVLGTGTNANAGGLYFSTASGGHGDYGAFFMNPFHAGVTEGGSPYGQTTGAEMQMTSSGNWAIGVGYGSSIANRGGLQLGIGAANTNYGGMQIWRQLQRYTGNNVAGLYSLDYSAIDWWKAAARTNGTTAWERAPGFVAEALSTNVDYALNIVSDALGGDGDGDWTIANVQKFGRFRYRTGTNLLEWYGDIVASSNFVGNASGLTNFTGVAMLAGDQIFTGDNTFTGLRFTNSAGNTYFNGGTVYVSDSVNSTLGFVGPGSGLTALNASAISSGTIPNANLPGNVITNGQSTATTISNTFTVAAPSGGAGQTVIASNTITTGNLTNSGNIQTATLNTTGVASLATGSTVGGIAITSRNGGQTANTIPIWLNSNSTLGNSGVSASSGNLTAASITGTNFLALSTNYVAANFVPISGQVKFCASNRAVYAVSDTFTNLITGP